MFIAQAFKPGNEFWKYLVGSVIVIGASFVGQIPLTIAIMAEALSKGEIPTNTQALLSYLDLNLTLFLLLLSFAFAMLGLWIVVRKMHNQKFKDIVTSRAKTDWKRVFFAFSVWGVFSVGMILLVHYTEPGKYILQFNPAQFAILAIIAVLMIPVQTSVEELVFRGYLMQGFGLLAKNRWFPLVMTSVIFGVMHIANPEIGQMGYIALVYYIGTGFALGIMTLMDEGTELALGFHAVNNLTAALLVTSDWSAFQTHSVFKDVSDPSAGIDIILPVVVIYPLLLLLFSYKYKWTGWKEKLTGRVYPQKEIEINEIGQKYE
ncbi:CPBP family intramembrane glutamic endopeptidase [uncultured Flavobacterium sp.]|uniref:CPBP family intramembrane glutamic endopeptidase n=1 Tax=uncultured Flavobacterium sp. TaxID=165435 RepID=UPI0025CC524D|nr:CPBP family intramembrane glutamic endopeptidase [uncultured Flavobacterium sp.]